MSRLTTDGYVRPAQTMTDKLSNEEKMLMLQDYKEVTTWDSVALGTNIRYFQKVDNEYKFRIGGRLIKKSIPNYVVLKSSKSWCAQLKDCIFFAQENRKELIDEIKEVLDKKNDEINELRALNKHCLLENNKLKNEANKKTK